ncbi:hypothetical protein RDABS01_039249 [Bienertia sinuspersici]
MVCYVVGANPSLAIMEGFMKCIWGNLGVDKVVPMGKGIFLVRFVDTNGCMSATNRGPQDNPRITFPRLDLKYSCELTLLKLVGIVEESIKLVAAMKNKDKLSFARILVERKVEDKMPNNIQFVNEKWILMEHQVEYEWKPILCTQCHRFGHEASVCRKGVQKNWIPKMNDKKSMEANEDGFLEARHSRRREAGGARKRV